MPDPDELVGAYVESMSASGAKLDRLRSEASAATTSVELQITPAGSSEPLRALLLARRVGEWVISCTTLPLPTGGEKNVVDDVDAFFGEVSRVCAGATPTEAAGH